MATNSIRSDALEPTAGELKRASWSTRLTRLLPVYGLPILALLLIALFSVILPDTFPTLLNLRSIIADKAIIALLSLAAMIPMVSGKIDLTVGYGIVLWHILAISLQTMYGLPWPLAVAVVLVLGALVGLINGILVEVAFIDSFIATSAPAPRSMRSRSGTRAGARCWAACRRGSWLMNGTMVFGLPITGFYVLAFAFFLWFVLEYLPVGRYLYAIGANPRAAALNGIPVRRYTIAAFVVVGTADGGRRRPAGLEAEDRPGERRPGISSACACRRLFGLDDDQARPRQRLGHDGRRRDPRGRHRGHSAVRRLILGRADVQQRDAPHLDRHRRLRPAAPQPQPRLRSTKRRPHEAGVATGRTIHESAE